MSARPTGPALQPPPLPDAAHFALDPAPAMTHRMDQIWPKPTATTPIVKSLPPVVSGRFSPYPTAVMERASTIGHCQVVVAMVVVA